MKRGRQGTDGIRRRRDRLSVVLQTRPERLQIHEKQGHHRIFHIDPGSEITSLVLGRSILPKKDAYKDIKNNKIQFSGKVLKFICRG